MRRTPRRLDCNTMASESAHHAPPPLSGCDLDAYRALTTGAGYRRLDDRLFVRVSGDDRVSFLHGMCTADVKQLAAGQVAEALFVTERAHLIAELYVYALVDCFLLELERDSWPRILAHLERFLVADDVEFEPLDDLRLLAVAGPEAAAFLGAQSFGTIPDPWRIATHDQLRLWTFPRASVPSCGIIAAAAAAEQLETVFSAAIPQLTAAALETVRIENGVARLGVDTNDKTLALEARLGSAISLTKGCYIGQETLERATARGGIKRRLCGLRLSAAIAPGAPIFLGDNAIGTLTSAANSPAFGPIGLAILHHSAWPAQTRVTIGGDAAVIEAAVVDLPFAPSSRRPLLLKY